MSSYEEKKSVYPFIIVLFHFTNPRICTCRRWRWRKQRWRRKRFFRSFIDFTKIVRPYSPLANVIQTGVFCLVAGAGGILFSINLYKKKRKSQNLLNKIDDLDPSWNQDQLDQRIEETYYSVQKAWSKKDLSTLQKYLSPPLYDRWLIKLNFMDLRHEENVLKNIQLLDHKIVSVHDFQENEKDSFWVYIKGKMIDYTVDMETREIKEGSTKPSEFIEYWRFLRDKDTFVLDEIAQKEDKSLDVFTDFSENNSM